MSRFSPALLALTLVASSTAFAAVVGTNPPARPLTPELISTLPAAEQAAWQKYFDRSVKQHAVDEAFLEKEMKAAGIEQPLIPPKGKPVSLKQADAWFASDEARQMAAMVVSFQTPAGGWNKNTKMTERARLKGERFGLETGYVGTFDNDATITELRFLAKVSAATDAAHSAQIRAAFVHGAEYIFAAQYPNGGWPQVWPLEGGYHDAITLNDGAMINIMTFLRDLASGRNEFTFTAPELRTRAAESMNRGLASLLKMQITAGGRRTVWGQQHDVLTLESTSARNYEMPSQTSSESAGVMMFLMEIEKPSPEVVAAVHSAAAWFKKTAIAGKAFKSTGDDGRHLVSAPMSELLWPRYSEIGTDRPLFGDRDKTIHDNVEEISKERRNGYSWYNSHPSHVLEHYEKWAKAHPPAASAK